MWQLNLLLIQFQDRLWAVIDAGICIQACLFDPRLPDREFAILHIFVCEKGDGGLDFSARLAGCHSVRDEVGSSEPGIL